MHKRHLDILSSLVVLFFLCGCATTAIKQDDADIQVLKNRVSFLEAQIANLTSALEKEKQEKQDLLTVLKGKEADNLTQALQKKESKEQAFTKSKGKTYHSFLIRIQLALKNAGFNPGFIDGKMGRRTRAALKEFQKTNNLPIDGCVNKQTWNLLRNYL